MSVSDWPGFYTLPSSPSITCQDRFGLLDSDTLDVPFWSVLVALLEPSTVSPSIPSTIDVLESIAVELRGHGPPDYETLKANLLAREDDFLTSWPAIARLALSMPQLFPSHQLPVLKESGTKRLDLTRRQVGCLVAHQFLGTMAAPAWQTGFQNFELWFAGEQPHAVAPGIYLTAVLNYFTRIAASPSLLDYREWRITYELFSRPAGGDDEADANVVPGEVDLQPMSALTAEAEFLGTDGNAVVISANKFIGFGRSATQEEVFVGSSPEACPVVLVAPPLGDRQVVVVRGCEAMVKTVGQARRIGLAGVHEDTAADSVLYERKWQNRTMLFMDALELDSFDGSQYPDVDKANVTREMAKALVAFGSGRYHRVNTGLWGCRTFGGDPGVKMVILWIAASIHSAALTITYETDRGDFAIQMQQFTRQARDRGFKVSDVYRLLLAAGSHRLPKGTFLDWASSQA